MKVTKDLDVSIEGHHVLVVEDIVDSGVTLTYLMNVLKQRRPKSLQHRDAARQTRAPAAAGGSSVCRLQDSG